MKNAINIALIGLALCVAGCVSKVTSETPGHQPAYRDRWDQRFDRPGAQVFEAAKRALNSYGIITRESMSADPAKPLGFIEGTLNQYRVYIRVEGVGPAATAMTVQIRAGLGGTDLKMAQEIIKRTEFELSARP